MSVFIETVKPSSLAEAKGDLYYMFSNSQDILGTSYQKITTEEELDIAYKVYCKVEEDTKLCQTDAIQRLSDAVDSGKFELAGKGCLQVVTK